jgi:hypothetical protein
VCYIERNVTQTFRSQHFGVPNGNKDSSNRFPILIKYRFNQRNAMMRFFVAKFFMFFYFVNLFTKIYLNGKTNYMFRRKEKNRVKLVELQWKIQDLFI